MDGEQWICALLEGRGSDKVVGIAAFNQQTRQLVCVQFTDTATYSKAIAFLKGNPPRTVLFSQVGNKKQPQTSQNGEDEQSPLNRASLASRVEDEFPNAEIFGIARKYWNSSEGRKYVEKLALEDDQKVATVKTLEKKWYALSAIAALFRYLELRLGLVFPSNSVEIRCISADKTMEIDSDTANALELVTSSDGNTKRSLFGLLDHCVTRLGSRLLRSNILAPLTDVDEINARLDCIDELSNDDFKFETLRRALQSLKSIDGDKLLSDLVESQPYEPKGKGSRNTSDAAAASEKKITLILTLYKMLEGLHGIATALSQCKAPLFIKIRESLQDECHAAMRTTIKNTVADDVLGNSVKGSMASRDFRVHAVKNDAKMLLQVARTTYLENLQDVAELAHNLSSEHDLRTLTSNYLRDGFQLSCDRTEWDARPQSRIFTNVVKTAKKVHFTCLQLQKKNQRVATSLEEVFKLSDEAMDDVIELIRDDVVGYTLGSASIATLDAVVALAKAASGQSYVRPKFAKDLAIKNGRHPLMERLQSRQSFVPNDTFLDQTTSFQIISGANAAGKSTYLRQIALLSIMAQIGSYVPAEYANFPIYDCLHSRLLNDDVLEENLSHFAAEMRTMSMILAALKTARRALILVDELGRATSEEGSVVAYAIAEEIADSPNAHCFFASHMRELAVALSHKPNAVCLTLTLSNYTIADGLHELTHYGLECARTVDMLKHADRIAKRLDLNIQEKEDAVAQKEAAKARVLLGIQEDLRTFVETAPNLNREQQIEYLREMQQSAAKSIVAIMRN